MILAILADYKHPRMLFLSLPLRRKVQKLDFQSEFSMSKIILTFLIFFSLKNKSLGTHYLLKCFFVTSILKNSFITKIRPNFAFEFILCAETPPLLLMSIHNKWSNFAEYTTSVYLICLIISLFVHHIKRIELRQAYGGFICTSLNWLSLTSSILE